MNQEPTQPTPPKQPSEAATTDGSSADSAPQLLQHVDMVRRRRQRECVHLLQELTPHLHAARTVERELDRNLARRFNVFRYLRDDELGLSRIIAELLDPFAEHGQGTIFLEAILELLQVSPEATDPGLSGQTVSGGYDRAATWTGHFGRLRSTTTDKIRVVQERWIPGPRFIDVTVDIPIHDGLFCLAFENKPYANDQPLQCRDYLRFLHKLYGERFLLVYLPPRYRMPDESSLPLEDRERWKNHFRVLPYVADDALHADDDSADGDGAAPVQVDPGEDDDAFAGDDATGHDSAAALDDAAVGDGASLADWFGTCCKLCDVERLRWFLREAQLYCQHHFGASTMTDTEVRYIHEYLEENPRHLHAAFALHRTWPAIKHDVCRRFLEHLRDRVGERFSEAMPEIREDLQVSCQYEGDKRWSTQLRLMETIIVKAGGPGPIRWLWGVHNPSPKTLSDELLAVALKRRGLSLQQTSDGWPQWEFLPRYGNWEQLVPELVQELADGGGEITRYYVDGLLKIAEKAIPAFEEVEQR